MRTNLPVTGRVYAIPSGATLMSTTDLDSRITYANAAFVQASGFQRDELVGQPHNLVRHPDMPSEAFADMWSTLQSGLSWSALVKNRRCNGDHYWVQANATPMRRNGQVVGYLSVRTPAAPQQVQEAERLYADLREGRTRGRKLYHGLVVRTGAAAWMSALQLLPLRARLGLIMGLGVALAVLPALLLGGAACCWRCRWRRRCARFWSRPTRWPAARRAAACR
jgi:aerotaxis receptor